MIIKLATIQYDPMGKPVGYINKMKSNLKVMTTPAWSQKKLTPWEQENGKKMAAAAMMI